MDDLLTFAVALSIRRRPNTNLQQVFCTKEDIGHLKTNNLKTNRVQ